MEIIKAINLNKVYGKGITSVHAVNKVNLSIKEGEFVAVVGPSGGGKSTLLHLLGGLDQPSSGKVLINNQDIYDLPNDQRTIFRRRKIGFIFQFFNLIPILTVRENIGLPLELDGEKPDKELIDEISNKLGLGDRMDHYPNELSGGEQQRTAIARALIHRPSIIFADEPTGNLDRKNSESVLNILRLFNSKYGITIVMITHNLQLAAQADRIITMQDGKI
ncbi:MAG: ABC transporter ATP-binding protein [Tissierellia bacterium]|nr:ABC transporter ATP-binding protein [Tissierellia bacterium]